jgi:thiamine biosynthesis protein ThiI
MNKYLEVNKLNFILVRTNEIALKNKNKNIFMNKLKKNIENIIGGKTKIKRINNRLYLYISPKLFSFDKDVMEEKLKKVFGIHSISYVHFVKKNINEIEKKSYTLVDEYIKLNNSKSFKVEVKRADKSFHYKSIELASLIGEKVLNKFKGLKVDVKNPDLILYIEIRKEGVYLFSEKILCAGGLPVGTSSRGSLLLSGGIDSPVAGALMQKRGMIINAVSFHSPPFTGSKTVEKIIELGKKLSYFNSNPIDIYMVPLTKVQKAFKDVGGKNIVVLQRRSMMRIASKISDLTNTNLLITGESLGQVASQTVENLTSISNVTEKIIIRPLIGFDKQETIELSKKYGLYDTSIKPQTDSCTIFLPSNPVTKSKISILEDIENKIKHLEFLENELLKETKKFRIFKDEVEQINTFENIAGGTL